MPIITTRDRDAMTRLRNQRVDRRGPYREAIAALSGDRVVELIPDTGESLRKLKGSTSRAAKDLGRDVKYGETEDGTLLVWLADGTAPRRRRRRRAGPADQVAEVQ